MNIHKTGRKEALWRWAPIAGWSLVTLAVASLFFRFVDLKPKVDENFFFSSQDPQFKSDKIISEIFPQPPQLVIGVKGDIHSPEYAEHIRNISDALAALDEVFSVQSLTHGPNDVNDAFESPLWKRVLLSKDGRATFISVFIKEVPAEQIVPKIEAIRDQFHGPGFEVMISGAPYIVEMIGRHLFQDLQIFSAAGLIIFSLVLYGMFRSARILFGTLVACLNASMLTLIVARMLHIQIGPLTANLSTMVFVFTISYIVFLTFAWRQAALRETESSVNPVSEAVRRMRQPIFWSMLTTFLGFLSLLFGQATPLRQLGISGAIGTLLAFLSAFLIYPQFLASGRRTALPQLANGRKKEWTQRIDSFFRKKHGRIAGLIFVLAFLGSFSLWKLDFDPNLFSYFNEKSELRKGLEYIDRNGGSNPLKIVVADRKGAPLNTRKAFRKLWKLQKALERNSAVGNVVSLPVILAEARRSPLAFLLTTGGLVDFLESPKAGEIAKYFITENREKTFFLLRMKEMNRASPRLAIVRQIEDTVQAKGFAPALVGGVYLLQGKLSQLLIANLISGLIALVVMFVIISWLLSRSYQVAGAVWISICLIPLLTLGVIGFLRMPLDIISVPGVSVALGMGVDAMIHLLIAARRRAKTAVTLAGPWQEACSELWRPILCSMILICSGFAIFGLSSFPPTQRFGLSVILGAVISPLTSLLILPFLAARQGFLMCGRGRDVAVKSPPNGVIAACQIIPFFSRRVAEPSPGFVQKSPRSGPAK